MIRRYLREHLPLAGLLALFAGTFARCSHCIICRPNRSRTHRRCAQ